MEREQIDHWFQYHAPVPDQLMSYQLLRESGRNLAHAIFDLCPESADKSAAIRLVREAVMTANAAIACRGK
jgi:hypothetical protein